MIEQGNGFALPLLLLHAAATTCLTGLVWFVQVVHYPLFARVGSTGFVAYENEHARRTGWIVMPAMLLEAASATLLALWTPGGMPPWIPWLGLVLLGSVWLSTWTLQVPRHRSLARGFDAAQHRALVSSNWLRTVAWSLRSGLALWMLAIAGR